MLHTFKEKVLTALLIGTALTAPAIAKTLRAESNPASTEPLATMRAEHVMLTTVDYQGTLSWYQNKLGFRIKHEWTVPEFPDLKLAYLEKNGFIIEVVSSRETQAMATPDNFAERLQQPGVGHFAFLVADVDEAIATLKEKDVTVIVPPTSFPNSGRRVAFFEDNNGNLIEFLEELPLGERQPYTGGEF